MQRENQTLIALRLDPELLAAVDQKRSRLRKSRSQFIRDAIYEAVKDLGISEDVTFPQDRVGESKGGRPKKPAIVAVPGTGTKKKPAARKEAS